MSKKGQGLVLIAVGVIVVVLSLAADLVGIGGVPGIGWKQLAGAGIGLVLLVFGLWWSRDGQDQAK